MTKDALKTVKYFIDFFGPFRSTLDAKSDIE